MKSFDAQINTVKERIYHELNHPYLTDQLNQPNIDETKLSFLFHLLDDQNLPSNLMEDYALSIVLIQLALDTHDLVENKLDFIDQKTQLTVLAGDFYSGLYYQILAGIENIKFIQVLASGIKMVNENKMRVYNLEVKSFEDFMESMKIIESMVCQKVALFFENKIWQEIAADWLHLYHLLTHKNWYINFLIKSQLLTVKISNKQQLVDIAEANIQDYITNLENKLIQELQKTKYSHLLHQLPGISVKRSLV